MEDLEAGDFASWLEQIESAVTGGDSDVPCDGCTACCRSSHFIRIESDESEALARIPAAMLVPVPGASDGALIMGYDERGHCPMLVENRCSIYEHRPRACRSYDCRVFPATGVVPDRSAVAEQSARWVFGGDQSARAALSAAVAYLRDRTHRPGAGTAVPDAAGLAVAAIRIHRLFRDGAPSDDEVEAVLRPQG